jgi:uncharacterized ion transporter superfamily protein YfcC
MAPPRLPDALTLLVSCVLVAAALSHVLPAGQYERTRDPVTGRNVVVAGSYHRVPASPVGPFQTLVAIPKGLTDAASVIFLVFLVGGAFSVVDETGSLRQGAEWLAARLGHRRALVVPIACSVFALGGVLEGMWEEIIALTPVVVMLARRVGFDELTAVSMSLGAAGIGGAFSPLNPFNVGIAQKLAELPLLSGGWFRIAVLIPAVGIWTWGTMRHAVRTQSPPTSSDAAPVRSLGVRHAATLLAVVAAFAVYVFGTLRYDWGFDELSALFLLMGIAAGLFGGLGIDGTARTFVAGFRTMAYGSLLIGFSRAIYVALDQGKIVDTIIHAMLTPLAALPAGVFAVGMAVVQTAIAIPVPSSSGRAVLTMPILVPLSDLLGVSRQVTVLAIQYGPGVLVQILPTDGALMAILALAGVRYEQWLRFAAPLCIALFLLSIVAIGAAIAIGLQ